MKILHNKNYCSSATRTIFKTSRFSAFWRISRRIQSSPFPLHPSRLQRGFTLVELLVYMGIFTILLAIFIQMFGNLMDTQLESSATSSVSVDVKYILARFGYDMSQSQIVTSPAPGVSSSTLQLVENGTTVTYASSSGNLTLTNANGTDQLNGSDTSISNLSFTPLGSSSGKLSVKMSFTITSKTIRTGNHTQSENIHTTVELR